MGSVPYEVRRQEAGCRGVETRYDDTMFDLSPDALRPADLAAELAGQGYATRMMLPAGTCATLAALYDDNQRFRKRIAM